MLARNKTGNSSLFKMKRGKRGLSEVISVVLLLALTIILVGIIWGVVGNLVKENLNNAGSCVDTFGKVTLNNELTCYNSSTNELQFSLGVGDLDNLQGTLIGIASGGNSATFKILSINSSVSNVVSYPDRNSNVALPAKNGGATYLFDLGSAGLSGVPESITIAPIIGTSQCDVSDSIQQIDDCNILNP